MERLWACSGYEVEQDCERVQVMRWKDCGRVQVMR